MKIGDSVHLADFAIVSPDFVFVSHDLAIVSNDRVILAFPSSDPHRRIEVSPRSSFSIGFQCSSSIAIICLVSGLRFDDDRELLGMPRVMR